MPDSLPLRKQARPAHLARLEALQQQGRLVLAGPMPKVDAPDMPEHGFQGSLILAELPSLAEAQQWAQEDPYLAAGAYKKYESHPLFRLCPSPLHSMRHP